MLRYSFGLEYAGMRPATEAEKAHVRSMADKAKQTVKRLRILLFLCVVAFVVGFLLILSVGMAIVMIDLYVAGRIVLSYRDAKRPLALLERSVEMDELAMYGDPSHEWSTALHPTSGLLVAKGGVLVDSVIQVEGVDSVEPGPHPHSGWYRLEREFERGLDRRPLSLAEITELNTVGAHVKARGNAWLLLALWVFAGCLLAQDDSKAPLPPALVIPCWIGLSLVLGLLLHRNRLVFLLWRDQRDRHVLRAEDGNTRVEFLPHSRILWTEDGEPSQLRKGGVFTLFTTTKDRSILRLYR